MSIVLETLLAEAESNRLARDMNEPASVDDISVKLTGTGGKELCR